MSSNLVKPGIFKNGIFVDENSKDLSTQIDKMI